MYIGLPLLERGSLVVRTAFDPMSHLALQRYFAVICLLMVGLGRIVLPGGVVVCQDQNGGRIEFGCARTADGSCTMSCDTDGQADDDHDLPSPCQDDPVENDPAIAKAPHRVGEQPQLAAPIAIPVVSVEVDACRSLAAAPRPCISNPRPPDDVVRLRTVVLLV